MSTEMQCDLLYDSANFAVVHTRGVGFEIADKRRDTVTMLTGAAALYFTGQTKRWQEKTPCAEEVEECLDNLSWLGSCTLTSH